MWMCAVTRSTTEHVPTRCHMYSQPCVVFVVRRVCVWSRNHVPTGPFDLLSSTSLMVTSHSARVTCGSWRRRRSFFTKGAKTTLQCSCKVYTRKMSLFRPFLSEDVRDAGGSCLTLSAKFSTQFVHKLNDLVRAQSRLSQANQRGRTATVPDI